MPQFVLSFYGYVSSEDTRVLVFLPAPSLTVDARPWLSKSVTMRCSLSGALAAVPMLFHELVTILKLSLFS